MSSSSSKNLERLLHAKKPSLPSLHSRHGSSVVIDSTSKHLLNSPRKTQKIFEKEKFHRKFEIATKALELRDIFSTLKVNIKSGLNFTNEEPSTRVLSRIFELFELMTAEEGPWQSCMSQVIAYLQNAIFFNVSYDSTSCQALDFVLSTESSHPSKKLQIETEC